MPRLTTFATVLAAVASGASAVDVGTCAEFAAVDRKTETEVTITTADFACDDYTRLSIRTDMVLKSSVGKVTFSNLALKVYGSLTVEPDVVFTGVTLVEKSGGAMKLELGSVGVFKGTTEFIENSIISTNLGTIVGPTGGTRDVEQGRKGGAIHNKGSLTFEKDATFTGNRNDGVEVGSGPGGAISVHVKGSVHFMGNLNMTSNIGDDYFGGAEGGALYNRGDIIVDGEATFAKNKGGRGGAIYQEKWATIVFNDFVEFTSNTCYDTNGGAVANMGGDFTSKAGTLFFDSFAENSGDGGTGGGIYNYNGGIVTLEGPTTFRQNYAFRGGAFFNRVDEDIYANDDFRNKVSVITFPDDTVFEDNYGEFCNDGAYNRDEDCGL